MRKLPLSVVAAAALMFWTAGFVDAKIQGHPWTVIEYPMGQEVVVDLVPWKLATDAKGSVRVTRGSDEVALRLELSGVADDIPGYHLYAVDQTGKVTSLGLVKISEGVGTLTASTPLHKFMLVLSSLADLTTIAEETPVLLSSAVPSGFSAVPRETPREVSETDAKTSVSDTDTTLPVSDPDAKTLSPSPYRAPMLDIPTLKLGREIALRVEVIGEMHNAKPVASVKRLKGGIAQITFRLQNLKRPATDSRYVLWAISSDDNYLRLGEANPAGRSGAKIASRAALEDFGLFVTAESSQGEKPAGELVAKVGR